MKRIAIVTTTLLLVVFGGVALAEEPAASEDVWNNPKNISGSVWLTTDYVFRGVSNTDSEPAVQGSLDYTFKGFYIGIWGSPINSPAYFSNLPLVPATIFHPITPGKTDWGITVTGL